MQNNLDAYTKVDEKKRKKSPFMPNVEGCIDAFNQHVAGVGAIPGTGMSEAVEDDVPVGDDIFKAVLNEFPVTDFPEKGASYILPSGKFLDPDKSHGEVDEFIVTHFPQIDLMDYPNSYMVDSEQCVRVNDGRGKSFTYDRYITLPKYLTTQQIYSIEKWLKEYPYEEITVGDTFGHAADFNLEDGITYLMNRIKKYKNTQILSEGYESINEADLPDLSENNIIADEDAGISSMFIDAVNECWSMIDNYHSMIVTLDSLNRHEFDETLRGLLDERNKEVGALQGILELLAPGSPNIEIGKEEAQDQISFDEVGDDSDEGLLEDFSGKELTMDNIIQWIKDNHPRYAKRICKEFGASLDSIPKRDLISVLEEVKLIPKLCADFGITENKFYSLYLDIKEEYDSVNESETRA